MRRAAGGPPPAHLVAVALLAAGGLSYEISLTRLLSALLISSWVGPVLAVALAGLGLGAALAAVAGRFRTPVAARTAAGAGALLMTLSLPAWLWSVASGRPLLGLALPLLAYLAAGVAGAAVLSWWPPRAASLLRADYGAAALAALGTPWLLGQLGEIGLGALGAALVGAALLAVAAVALSGPKAAGPLPLAAVSAGVAAVCLALLALLVGGLGVEPGRHMSAKPISQMLGRGGVVVESRWDATARTDLVRAPNGANYLYMDGGAGSLVPTPDPGDWSQDVGAFAFAMAPARSAFLIGTGGGLDVAQARAAGLEQVVAVEVNPQSVALVRELGAATDHVYESPTEVVIGDGRRVLASRGERYDVITLANVVTGAAELRGAALTENRVYTVEAFAEYLAHLTPDGRLALKLYDELTLTRAVTTALGALIAGGYAADEAAAAQHLTAVLEASGPSPVPVLVVTKEPLGAEQAVAAARVAERRGWSLLLVPGLLAPPALQPLVEGRTGLDELVASVREVDLSPTHDNAPYFFSFEPGVPRDARRSGLAAAVVLVALVLVSLGAGRALAREQPSRSPPAVLLPIAVLLGGGFLLVELGALPLVQGAAGQPAWSLSLTLGAVLLGSAVGAQLASRSAATDVASPALLAAAAVLAWGLLSRPLSSALVGLPPLAAGAVLAALLLLASVPLGMPFPRLLAALGRPSGVAAALALSGLAAVAAGAGALWLAHSLGQPALLGAAALAYLSAAVLGWRGRGTASVPPSGEDPVPLRVVERAPGEPSGEPGVHDEAHG